MFARAVCCTLIIQNELNTCSKFPMIGHSIASFPGSPAPECNHDNHEEPGIFSHMWVTLQVERCRNLEQQEEHRNIATEYTNLGSVEYIHTKHWNVCVCGGGVNTIHTKWWCIVSWKTCFFALALCQLHHARVRKYTRLPPPSQFQCSCHGTWEWGYW